MDKWNRMRINRIKAGAYLASSGTLHIESDASPAEAMQAARELLGTEHVEFTGRSKHARTWMFEPASVVV